MNASVQSLELCYRWYDPCVAGIAFSQRPKQVSVNIDIRTKLGQACFQNARILRYTFMESCTGVSPVREPNDISLPIAKAAQIPKLSLGNITLRTVKASPLKSPTCRKLVESTPFPAPGDGSHHLISSISSKVCSMII